MLQFEVTGHRPNRVEWGLGAALERVRERYDLSQPAGTENPFSTDPTPIHVLTFQHEGHAFQGAVHSQVSGAPAPRMRVTVGTRLARQRAGKATVFEPRVGITWASSSAATWSVAVGRQHQSPPTAYRFSDPINLALRPARVDRVSARCEWVLAPGVRSSLECFVKRDDPLPASTEHPTWTLASQQELTGPSYS